MPANDPSAAPLTQSDLERVKKLCQLEVVEPEHDNIERLVEREKAYIELYESEMLPDRQTRIDLHKERLERKANI